MLIQTLDHQEL